MAKKYSWLATETESGWKVSLVYGKDDKYSVRGLLLKNTDQIKKLFAYLNVCFVWMKANPKRNRIDKAYFSSVEIS